jgi:hypothetical protein
MFWADGRQTLPWDYFRLAHQSVNELRQLVQELQQQYGMEPKEIRVMVEDMMKTMAKTASGT